MVDNLLTTDYKKISSSKGADLDLVITKLENYARLLEENIKIGQAKRGAGLNHETLADDAENVERCES